MTRIPLQKILVMSDQENHEQLLSILEKNEIIDIKPAPENTKAFSEQNPSEFNSINLESQLSTIEHAISFIESFLPKKSFFDSLINAKPILPKSDFNKSAASFNHQDYISQIKQSELEWDTLLDKESHLKEEKKLLLPWLSLNLPLSSFYNNKIVRYSLGSIKKNKFNHFNNKINKITNVLSTHIIHTTSLEHYILVIYTKAEEKVIKEFLSLNEFNSIILPNNSQTPKQRFEEINQELIKLIECKKQFIENIIFLSESLIKLKCVYDYKYQQKDFLSAKKLSFQTKYLTGLVGWIKKRNLNKLSHILSEEFNHQILVQAIEREKDELPPTYIENPKAFKPFETITRIFGLPTTADTDPTRPLSIFFIVFFGICLGDAGYGIILSLVCLYLLRNNKISAGGKMLIRLLFLGGITSFIAGLLTGSWLGDAWQYFPFSKNLLAALRIVDPINNAIGMLIFSLSLGAIQILFGILVRAYHHATQGLWIEAILDDLSWFFYLSSLLGLLVFSFTQSQLMGIAVYGAVISSIFLILTQGRHHKNIFMKLFSGLLSLYSTSSYLGDLLSYSRLLALGLSSAIIAMVVNLLSNMVKDSIPVVGILFMVLIFIGGHIFNLSISVLGAFVHSARLQLVEFFGKFYEGGGKEFQPFRKVNKYLMVK